MSTNDFYLRYYVGHKGKFGHEFLEFEFRPDGMFLYLIHSIVISLYLNITCEVSTALKLMRVSCRHMRVSCRHMRVSCRHMRGSTGVAKHSCKYYITVCFSSSLPSLKPPTCNSFCLHLLLHFLFMLINPSFVSSVSYLQVS